MEEISIKEIFIKDEFIKLSAFLKFSGALSTGGDAKLEVKSGNVRVNGEVCYERGKKLKDGDIVKFNEELFKVVKES